MAGDLARLKLARVTLWAAGRSRAGISAAAMARQQSAIIYVPCEFSATLFQGPKIGQQVCDLLGGQVAEQ